MLAIDYKKLYNNIRKGSADMASSLVQFRTDDATKLKAIKICEKLGIDLQTYMRMCISRLIQENDAGRDQRRNRRGKEAKLEYEVLYSYRY